LLLYYYLKAHITYPMLEKKFKEKNLTKINYLFEV